MKKQSKLTRGEKSNITRWYHDGLSVLQISDRIGATVTCVKARIKQVVIKDCEDLWSKIIYARASDQCEVTGSTYKTNAHHLLEKGSFIKYKFDLNNGICLCSDIHMFNVNISPHCNSHSKTEFFTWLKANKPKQWEWWEDNRFNKKIADIDIFQIHEDLKAVLESEV